MTTTAPLPPAADRIARPRRANPLRTEARRGSWAALVTVALLVPSLLDLLSRRGPAFNWIWTHDALRSAGLVIGVGFAVAAGCWHGGRERRRGTGELFSSMPVSPLRRTALAASPAVLWPVLAYVLTGAVCLLITWLGRGVPFGHPFPTLLVADAVAVGSLGLLGFIAGRLIPWILAAPVLATLVGVGTTVLGEGDILPAWIADGDALRWLAPTIEHANEWEEPVWWYGPLATLWFGGLAVAALLAYTAHRRFAAVSLATAVAAASVLVGTGDGLWRTDPVATAFTCTEGDPQVCMIRVHSPYLPEMSAAVAGLTSKLHTIPNAPDRLVEIPTVPDEKNLSRSRPIAAGLVPRRNEAVLSDAPPINYRENLGYYAENAAINAAVYGCVKMPYTYGSQVPSRYLDAVAQWLAPSREGMPGDSPAKPVLKRIKSMPERERTAWLGDYFAAVRDCDPGRIKAP